MNKIVFLSLGVTALFAVTVDSTVPASMDCDGFKTVMGQVKSYYKIRDPMNLWLETVGFVKPDNIFGANPTYIDCSVTTGTIAKIHTFAAQVFQNEYGLTPNEFSSWAKQCRALERKPKSCTRGPTEQAKYRPIDGRGNNLANPEYGASDTPFARFAPKGYSDGIYTPKKSSSGAELPNARYLVDSVLTKAARVPVKPDTLAYGVFALLTVLFITHDVHYQTAVQPSTLTQEIQCCLDDGSAVLTSEQQHPSCYPIEVSKDDSVYGAGNIGCINLVRSQTAEYSNQVQPGEIMNRATSYLDLSLIYGNHQSECDPIRLKQDGLLRMGKNDVLPVDENFKYLPSMARFTTAPMASIWPSLFARNHNRLARELKALNPHWIDEILFQEARRINIAIFQANLITSGAVQDSISKIPINETYSAESNAATTLEFAIAYRSAHYYIHDTMLFLDENNESTEYWQSDTIGRIDLLEDKYDEALRGALAQLVNADAYSDQITNRIGKNAQGYGSDIIAIDIQRARDQGLPSYLEVRRKCPGLKPIYSFDDLKFNPINIELLKNTYETVEDIDYYVGGVLEMLEILGNPLVGETFGCVIGQQWNHFAGGDLYYYTNQNQPHPLSPAQIKAIQSYSISGVVCDNSGLTETQQIWPYAPNSVNPIVSCDTFPTIDLSAWKETPPTTS